MVPHIKTQTVDGYYTQEQADHLTATVYNFNTVQNDFGKDIENFNLVAPDASEVFSKVFKMNLEVNQDTSGVFRHPQPLIHFEPFDSQNEWLFVVAIQQSMFNIYEHTSGAVTALDGYKYQYRNLFEWNLTTAHILQPGQGVLFRPWLFHSFDTGLIQLFRLNEKL